MRDGIKYYEKIFIFIVVRSWENFWQRNGGGYIPFEKQPYIYINVTFEILETIILSVVEFI